MGNPPYGMLREAEEKMRTMILDLDPDKEERVIVLINAAASYPNMSKYQVMKARVFLIDLYISHKIYGNAFDLCQLTLEEYPKAPIKRKLKAMEKIRDESPEEFVHSRNIDMVDSDLCFSEESGVEDYDPEFEKELEARLNQLPPSLKDTFYLHRSTRKKSDNLPFTLKEAELLELEAMERSAGRRLEDKQL